MRPERCQPSPDPTDDMRAMLETLLERQERADARNSQILALLEQLVPPPEPEPEPAPVPVPPLVHALAVAFGGDWFTSAEAMQRAEHDADLWSALQAERIFNAYALGRRLKVYAGAGVERAGQLWHV